MSKNSQLQTLLSWACGLRAMDPRFGVAFSVLGAQWGDEGKGKIVSWLVSLLMQTYGRCLTVRFQGGCNAGHNLILPGGRRVATHHIPEGVCYGGESAIGPGCLINPARFIAEVNELWAAGVVIGPHNLYVDPDTAVTTAYQIREEVLAEDGPNATGTTRVGISTTAAAVARKIHVTAYACVDTHEDHALLRAQLDRQRREYAGRPGFESIDYELMLEEIREFGVFLQRAATVCRVDRLVHARQRYGEHLVLVGGQGAHLDMHRNAPFGTSTPIWPPLGLGRVENIFAIGVAKQVPSAVGTHVLPTIMEPERAAFFRQLGGDAAEFGATTGRPRDVCDLFMPALREAVVRLGLDCLIFTKADLHTMPLVGCNRLRWDGELTDWWPSEFAAFDHTRPGNASARVGLGDKFVLPAIEGTVAGVRDWAALPDGMHERVALLEGMLYGVPILALGTGQGPMDIALRPLRPLRPSW